MIVNWADIIGDEPPDQNKPYIDRNLSADEEEKLSFPQKLFRNDGVFISKKLIPDKLIEHYCKVREEVKDPGGWVPPTPYEHIPQLRDICLFKPMMRIMKNLIGHEMMLHLNLTGWVSTERKWHSDDYLNPSFVNSHYVAVWIALDNIHRDSGPFQFVRGSNRWPLIRQEKIFKIMAIDGIAENDPDWPSKTQDWVAAACEEEIQNRKAVVETYLPTKGDVLFWSGRLIHRGSVPNLPGLQRKALIAHYSSIDHRPDMKKREKHSSIAWDSEGMYYAAGLPLK